MPSEHSEHNEPSEHQDSGEPGHAERTSWFSLPRERGSLLVAGLSTFMVFLDTTIVSVALPEIGRDLGSTEGLQWVVSAYLLALGVAQPVTGWVAARVGAKQALLATLGLFSLASLLAGAAPTLPLLIVARILQGLTGGLLIPLSTTILFAVFPPNRRGRVIGLSGMLVMAAPALGPVISGYVLTVMSWRWLMLLNIPVGLVGLLVGARFIPRTGDRERRPFDLWGLVLIGSGLAFLLYGFSETEGAGWTTPSFLVLVAAGLALLGGYVVRALRVDHPLVDLAIYRERLFSTAVAIAWAIALVQFGRTVFMPVQLQVVRGLSSLEAGSILALSGVASAMVMPFAGRWADRGSRAPVLTGTTLMGVAAARLATLAVDTPLWQVVGAMALIGFGIVLVTIPTTVVALNAIPEKLLTEAASVRSLNREIAGAVSTSVFAAVIAAQVGNIAATPTTAAGLAEHQDAYNTAFLVALVGVVVATLLAWSLPGPSGRSDAADEGVDEGAGTGTGTGTGTDEEDVDDTDTDDTVTDDTVTDDSEAASHPASASPPRTEPP